MAIGNRDFVSGSLVDLLEKKFKLDHDRPRIFSPFGLGVLDLAVGNFVLEASFIPSFLEIKESVGA
jgi:ornithine cyclodeaminase